jgi:plastocyanin
MNPARSLVLVASLLAAAVALSGCAQTSNTATPPMTANVEMSGLKFNPKETVVAVGGTVTWTNREAIPHDVKFKTMDVQSEGGKGGLSNGESWSYTFENAGTYEYYCEEHGMGMSGKITVR